ncbi:MAG: molybdopterin synthase catalytic subunit MoaE [Porticoccaceae bacterium]
MADDIRIQREDFILQAEYDRLRGGGGVGAVVAFTGLVRDFDRGEERGADPVQTLHLQHYPGMTERLVAEIVAEARGRWPIADVTVIHRVGELRPGDQIVLVAVSAAHRKEAFAAAEFLMDYLKTRATLWKKTGAAGGERWVDMNAADRSAAERWQPGDGRESAGG